MNGFVEDLEKVVTELYDIQVMLTNNGQKDGDDVVKIARQIQDLESHVNTAIITEKSVRKAQDNNLGKEMDRFAKQMVAI